MDEEPEDEALLPPWLDRQRYDEVKVLFDSGRWHPTVGTRYQTVRVWLLRKDQLSRRERDRHERYSDIIARAIAITSLMISAVSMWFSLHR